MFPALAGDMQHNMVTPHMDILRIEATDLTCSQATYSQTDQDQGVPLPPPATTVRSSEEPVEFSFTQNSGGKPRLAFG